jgi:glucose-1-phosphate cytidylyltransferase
MARRHLHGEEMFLANYGDVVTDANLPGLVADFRAKGKVAAFLCVRPPYTFHVVSGQQDGVVRDIHDVRGSDVWINGGYYIFRKEVFDYLGDDDELVEAPFRRLIADDQLVAYRYEGFWTSMDTLKDLQTLEALHDTGQPPWAVWLPEAYGSSKASNSSGA